MRNKSLALISAAAILALGGLSASSYGQTVTKAVANGDWATSATWDNGLPAASTTGNAGSGVGAEIDGNYNVAVDSSGDNAMFLNMGENSGDNSTLTVSNGDLTIADPAGTVGDNTPNSQILRIGAVAGASATVNQTGGSVTINGANGNIYDGHLYVGDAGTGTYNISGGSLTASDEIFIGGASGGTGTINATGGTVTAAGRNILVGGLGIAGTGTLNVGGTATVTANSTFFTGIFGNNITSNVTVNGNGTLQTAADPASGVNNFLLGSAFSAAGGSPSTTNFTIADNGTVSTDFLFAGYGQGAIVTMTQTGGTVNTLGMIIGENGASTTYNQSAGTLNVGGNSLSSFTVDEANAPATYNLSGTGTLNVNANLYCGRGLEAPGSLPGALSTGTINQSGGSITVAGNAYLGNYDGTTGVINHSGGSFHVEGDLSVAGDLADNGGQAINVRGTFTDTGNSGSIQVDGNLWADSGNNLRTDGINGTSGEQTYLNFGLDSTGVTLLNVNGGADITGAIINVYANPSVTLTVGDSFPLLSAGGGVNGTYFDPNDALFSLSVSNNTLYATILSAPLLGDANRDGAVDSTDYTTILNSFSNDVKLGGWESGDFNGDGVVNSDDWAMFDLGLAAYGSGHPITVPEPASLGLILAAGLGLAARRRRRA